MTDLDKVHKGITYLPLFYYIYAPTSVGALYRVTIYTRFIYRTIPFPYIAHNV